MTTDEDKWWREMRSTWLKRLKLRLILAGYSPSRGWLRRFGKKLIRLFLLMGKAELWLFRKSGMFCLLQKYEGGCPSCTFCEECCKEAKKKLGPIRKVVG